jgi:ATP-dependent DNA ligase
MISRTLQGTRGKAEKATLIPYELDCELIALDSNGKQCFQCLQGYLNIFHRSVSKEVEPPSAIIYYVFDILYLEGYDLAAVPLEQRKELLRETLAPDDMVKLVEYFPSEGEKVFKAAVDNGLEGVVAKKKQTGTNPASVLKPGSRSKRSRAMILSSSATRRVKATARTVSARSSSVTITMINN